MKTSDKMNNPNNKNDIHPYALHGASDLDSSFDIIRIPEGLELDIKKENYKDADYRLDFSHDLIAIAKLINRTPVFNLEKHLAIEQIKTIPDQCIQECSAIAEIIDKKQEGDFSPVPINPIVEAPNTEILIIGATMPLIWPSNESKSESQEPEDIFESNSDQTESKTEKSEPVIQNKVKSKGFSQIHSTQANQSITSSTEDTKASDFLAWIRSKNQQVKKDDIIKNTDESEESRLVSDLPTNQRIDKAEKKDKKDKKKSKKKKKKKKKAKKEKAKKKKLKKLLESSNEIGEEIISETLAKLLAHQGHTKKAIDMYEKLSLLNPKKSSYFAKIIQRLEEN